MATFYVYKREHYAVWEPAEGGYYVDASEITECEEFWYLEDAVKFFNKKVDEAEECDILDTRNDFAGFKEIRPGETTIVMPWALFKIGPYIGDEYEIGITVEKPEDRPYEGYR